MAQIDTSIYGNAQSFTDQYAKDQQIAASQEAQRQQQQLTKFQVLNAKQDFEDSQNMRNAYRQANGDPSQTLQIAAKLGVSPKMIQAFQAQQLDVRNKLADLDKTVTETGKTKLDMLNERHERLYGAIQPLLDIKDPDEFAAKLPDAIAGAKANGLITDDEASSASQMNQGHFRDYANGLLNIKAHTDLIKGQTDIQNANSKATEANVAQDKQNNEAAGQKADTILKQRQGAATDLVNAYNNGGAVAYKATLSKLDPNVAGFFADPDKVATMKMGDAQKLIGQGGMTAAELAQQQHNDAVLSEQSKYHAQEIKLRQQSNSFQAQTLQLQGLRTQASLFAAGLGPDGKPMSDTDKTLLTPATQNTSDGRNYIDQDAAYKALPKGQQLQLRNAAVAAGIPLLSGKEAASVKDVDNARNTINGVFQTFMQHAGSGTTGVLLKPVQGVGNYIGAASGVLPDLDAARKNFLGSIETMKSAGGQGSGLRITGAEIMKVGSMMPSLSDTQEQLQQKAKQINELINGKLNGALHQVSVTNNPDGSPKAAPASNPAAHVKTMADVQSIAKQYNVSPEEVAAEFRKKGWTVK